MTPDNLDDLLVKLRQAQQNDEPEEVLAALRKRITAASDYEYSQTRKRKESARWESHGIEYRPASSVPPVPRLAPNAEFDALRDKLRALLAGSELADQQDQILSLAEPYIILTTPRDEEPTAEERDWLASQNLMPTQMKGMAALEKRRQEQRRQLLGLGASRFGFVPDLPPEMQWPEYKSKRLLFLAQIDFSTLPRWQESLLPADGWLYVFAMMPNGGVDAPNWRTVCMYHRGERSALVRAPRPYDTRDYWDDQGVIEHDLLPIHGALGLDINHELAAKVMPDLDLEELRELVEKASPRFNDDHSRSVYGSEMVAGHLLGQVDDVAGTPAESINNAIDAGDADVVRIAKESGGVGDDWMNLMYLRSVGSMVWSDSGMLYFLIRRRELLQRRFDRFYMTMWSS